MKINDLSGLCVKISKRSITAQNSDGKTAGVVTGVTTWKNAAARVQFDNLKKVKAAGFFGCRSYNYMDHIIFLNNTIYYLHNIKHNPDAITRATAAGINVIQVYL